MIRDRESKLFTAWVCFWESEKARKESACLLLCCILKLNPSIYTSVSFVKISYKKRKDERGINLISASSNCSIWFVVITKIRPP